MKLNYYNTCNIFLIKNNYLKYFKVIAGGIIMIALNASGSEKTILFFGDSISTGVGASEKNKRFSSILTRKINTSSETYKEVNMAVSGSTLIGSSFQRILPKAIAARPDIFVIQHGTNDNAIGHSSGRFLYFYRQAVRKIKKKLPKTKIVCMTICPSWNHYNSTFAWLSLVNTGIQEIAVEENVLLANNFYKLKNCRNLFPDKIHPNNEGHKLMAEAVYEAIKKDKPLNYNKFNFIAYGPGKYRIAGYIIDLLPYDIAGSDGWTIFEGLGLKSFKYKSDYELKITTPRKSFVKAPKVLINKILYFQGNIKWSKQTGQACFTLPITKKYIKVTIKK